MSTPVVTVDFQADEVVRGLASYQACMKDKTPLHLAMAQGVETSVRDHLRGLNSRSPDSGFYGKAAYNTQVTAEENQGLVRVDHVGLALRFYGGRVLPKSVKNLAIPTDDVPRIGSEGRKPPRDMGVLAYLPKRGMDVSATTGYLVEGEEVPITRGKNKGGKRIVPKKGGKLLYTLRAWTDHNADESVLPSLIKLQQAAKDAGEFYIESITKNGSDA
jgi:hypothetical protein